MPANGKWDLPRRLKV